MFPRNLPFPDFILNVPCDIEVHSEGLNEDTGLPVILTKWNGMVNWSEKSKSVMTADKILISLVGTITCKGDISPDTAIQGGMITVYPNTPRQQTMRIYQSRRGRNLDGSVFSTELDLM